MAAHLMRCLATLVVAAGLFVSIPAFAQNAPKYATVTVKTCSVYEQPDEGATVKAKAKRGDYFEIGGLRGQWVKVRTSKGIVGYVIKTDVVPGKKELSGSTSGGATATPRSTPRTGGGGSGVTVEGRTGLLAKAGLGFAGNSYGFKAPGVKRDIGMKTAYAGINADVDYWAIPLAGAHGRFASTYGSMTAVLNAPINKRVDRIPTNINVIEIDAQGRYFLGGEDASSFSLLGRLGYHIHEMRIDPVVDPQDRPLFLVSNTYSGPVIGLGGDVPVGGPQMGVHALVNYWLAPSVTEGTTKGVKKPSGKPKSASGVGLNAGFYYNLNDQTGVDIAVDYSSFSGTFSGTGRRFNTDVSKSKTTDTYIQLLVNGTYRF